MNVKKIQLWTAFIDIIVQWYVDPRNSGIDNRTIIGYIGVV